MGVLHVPLCHHAAGAQGWKGCMVGADTFRAGAVEPKRAARVRIGCADGAVYEGGHLDGERHGLGRLTLRDSRVLEGEWRHGVAGSHSLGVSVFLHMIFYLTLQVWPAHSMGRMPASVVEAVHGVCGRRLLGCVSPGRMLERLDEASHGV